MDGQDLELRVRHMLDVFYDHVVFNVYTDDCGLERFDYTLDCPIRKIFKRLAEEEEKDA